MAAKKKSKKATKSKPPKKKLTSRKRVSRKKAAKKLTAKKRGAAAIRKKTGTAGRVRGKASRSRRASAAWDEEPAGLRSGVQSGDLQGLSDVESADSESVDELVEEGNAFEADAVAGVEHADDDQEREVRTHEVAEDDVPEEYQDQD